MNKEWGLYVALLINQFLFLYKVRLIVFASMLFYVGERGRGFVCVLSVGEVVCPAVQKFFDDSCNLSYTLVKLSQKLTVKLYRCLKFCFQHILLVYFVFYIPKNTAFLYFSSTELVFFQRIAPFVMLSALIRELNS